HVFRFVLIQRLVEKVVCPIHDRLQPVLLLPVGVTRRVRHPRASPLATGFRLSHSSFLIIALKGDNIVISIDELCETGRAPPGKSRGRVWPIGVSPGLGHFEPAMVLRRAGFSAGICSPRAHASTTARCQTGTLPSRLVAGGNAPESRRF